MTSDTSVKLVITSEFLGLEYLQDEKTLQDIIDQLKYNLKLAPIDLVIGVLPRANNFLLEHGEDIFPGIPKIFAIPNPRTINKIKELPDSAMILSAAKDAIDRNIRTIPTILPGTKNLFMVSGSGPTDSIYIRISRSLLKNSDSRLQVKYITGLPQEELLKEISQLPENSAILMLPYTQDLNKKLYRSVEVATAITKNTEVPVFGIYDSLFGSGIVGGILTSSKIYGEQAATVGLRILRGESPSTIPTVRGEAYKMYDWRQLKRWKIKESSLPPESDIRFKSETIWEVYKAQIIIAFVLLGFQTVLIYALLLSLNNRKKVEEALKENKGRLKLIIDKMPTGCILWNPDFKVDLWNPAATNMFAYSHEEAMGKHAYELIVDKELFPHVDKVWERLTSEMLPSHSINDNITKNGKTITCEWYNTPLMKGGKFIGVISMVQDISERKIAEKKLEETDALITGVIEQSPIAMAVATTDGVFQFINTAFRIQLGIEESDNIKPGTSLTQMKLTWKNYDSDGNLMPLSKLPMALTLKGKATKGMEVRVVRKDGSERWIIIDGVPIYNSQGDLIAGFVIFPDITNIKMAEKKMLSSLKEKEVLLKEVHHRVKNNMAVISSLLALQSSYIEDKKAIEKFEESRSRIQSMALVHEKLYQTEDFTNIDVRDYVQSLALTVKNTFGADTQYSVITEIDNINLDIDTLIPCGLIMNEILTNAYKHAFNEHDNPEIKVVMKQLKDNNISLIISDNGIGLPDGFDVTQNIGLGLQLVNTLVSQIDGALEVKSERGAEFSIVFPEKLEFARHVPEGSDD